MSAQLSTLASDAVALIENVSLRASAERWAYADTHRAAIDQHWCSVMAAGASYFNGTVYLTRHVSCDDVSLSAQLIPVEFKAYLYWRDQGYPAADIIDGFGSGLIRSREGAIVLVRQRSGNINSGLFYLPGGFIDPRDVGADGTIDLRASVVREVLEETGLGPDDLSMDGGYVVTKAGVQLSFAVSLRSSRDADDLLAQIKRHIAAHPEGELVDVKAVRAASDLVGLVMTPYAQALLAVVLPET